MPRIRKPFNTKRQSRLALPTPPSRHYPSYLDELPSALVNVQEAFAAGLESLREEALRKKSAKDPDIYAALCADKKISARLYIQDKTSSNYILDLNNLYKDKKPFPANYFANEKWSINEQKLAILLSTALDNNLLEIDRPQPSSFSVPSLESHIKINQTNLTDDDKLLIAQVFYSIKECGYWVYCMW